MNQKAIYNAILQTPELWFDQSIVGIEQYPLRNSVPFKNLINIEKRLGVVVEECIFEAIHNAPNSQVLLKNLQIIDQQVTLGELDCIFQSNEQKYHLEIAYKFYLFDPTFDNENHLCWIGPNRKDSFKEKLFKLKEKQLPLIHHSKTAELLSQHGLAAPLKQVVCFKAQLFIPTQFASNEFQKINSECIQGYYYRLKELEEFSENRFYLPSKQAWTLEPTQHVSWISFREFKSQLQLMFNQKRSPMFWHKDSKGNMAKAFAVWWE